MFKYLVGRIGCVFGKHERWKRYAKLDSDGGYIAPCRYCKVRMRQAPDASREWRVDREHRA